MPLGQYTDHRHVTPVQHAHQGRDYVSLMKVFVSRRQGLLHLSYLNVLHWILICNDRKHWCCRIFHDKTVPLHISALDMIFVACLGLVCRRLGQDSSVSFIALESGRRFLRTENNAGSAAKLLLQQNKHLWAAEGAYCCSVQTAIRKHQQEKQNKFSFCTCSNIMLPSNSS